MTNWVYKKRLTDQRLFLLWQQGFYPTYEALKLGTTRSCVAGWAQFLPYLWGIETPLLKNQSVTPVQFLPYLWGIETRNFEKFAILLIKVFTLPMRHWNLFTSMFFIGCPPCFYPTYEALKPNVAKNAVASAPLFLPYLWGIETSIVRKYTLSNAFVFTLPMRHWNPDTVPSSLRVSPSFYPTYEALKPNFVALPKLSMLPFLPYLWGIETRLRDWILERDWERFYPTYEALKPFCISIKQYIF